MLGRFGSDEVARFDSYKSSLTAVGSYCCCEYPELQSHAFAKTK